MTTNIHGLCLLWHHVGICTKQFQYFRIGTKFPCTHVAHFAIRNFACTLSGTSRPVFLRTGSTLWCWHCTRQPRGLQDHQVWVRLVVEVRSGQ